MDGKYVPDMSVTSTCIASSRSVRADLSDSSVIVAAMMFCRCDDAE